MSYLKYYRLIDIFVLFRYFPLTDTAGHPDEKLDDVVGQSVRWADRHHGARIRGSQCQVREVSRVQGTGSHVEIFFFSELLCSTSFNTFFNTFLIFFFQHMFSQHINTCFHNTFFSQGAVTSKASVTSATAPAVTSASNVNATEAVDTNTVEEGCNDPTWFWLLVFILPLLCYLLYYPFKRHYQAKKVSGVSCGSMFTVLYHVLPPCLVLVVY